MAWIKGSTIGSGNPTAWGQYDTIRGDGMTVQSDNNGAEGNYNTHPSGDLAPTITSVSPTNLLTGDGTGNFTIVITGNYVLTCVSFVLGSGTHLVRCG